MRIVGCLANAETRPERLNSRLVRKSSVQKRLEVFKSRQDTKPCKHGAFDPAKEKRSTIGGRDGEEDFTAFQPIVSPAFRKSEKHQRGSGEITPPQNPTSV